MAHYLSEEDAAILVTIPIAAAQLHDYIEAALSMIDGRINHRCGLTSNTTVASDREGLASVEYEAFLKVIQNTRLSREGVPAEIAFIDSFFSAESKFLMNEIKVKGTYYDFTIDSASKSELI